MLDKRAAAIASRHLSDYSRLNDIYMKINFFNADHTHALIDLPTSIAVEAVVKLYKGESSHWINEQRLLKGKFSWGQGYGAFSVSHSDVSRVAGYIANQEAHHRKWTYSEEYELFVKRYGLEWREETVETVSTGFAGP
jgi:putative transposase